MEDNEKRLLKNINRWVMWKSKIDVKDKFYFLALLEVLRQANNTYFEAEINKFNEEMEK